MSGDEIVADCLLAAKCLEETNTFETVQSILIDAAAEIVRLTVLLDAAYTNLDALDPSGMLRSYSDEN